MQEFCGKIEVARNSVTSTISSLTNSNIRGIEMATKRLPPNSQNKECSIDGCDGIARSRGWCHKHYARFRTNGSPLVVQFSRGEGNNRVERFWSRVSRSDNPAECWNWTSGLDPKGYGKVSLRIDGRLYQSANRVAYLFHYDKHPDELFVCHTCDNRACCNPHHLYLGTAKDNSRDAVERGRHIKGSASKRALLTERDVAEMRVLSCFGLSARELANIYPAAERTIASAISFNSWSHVDARGDSIRR